MKFTVITAVLASSVTATAESVKNLAGKSVHDVVAADLHLHLPRHRDLAVSTNDKDGIRAILKEHRASKMRNGGMVRRLQDKLKRSKLRNQPQALSQKDGDVSDGDMDLGFFSRNLQNETDTEAEPEPEEEMNAIEAMALKCGSTNYYSGPNYDCSCSNIDVDGYVGTTFCTYDDYSATRQNACGEYTQIDFVITNSFDFTASGELTTKRCYNVNSPMEPFSYCYSYSVDESSGFNACSFEVDGSQCNSCEFEYYTTEQNTTGTCRNFDCTNLDDDDITTGIVCGEESMTTMKLEPYLITEQLPCEGGCSLCPEGERMTNFDTAVTLLTGDIYSCSELNFFAGTGTLANVPGDLCNALPALVNGPCGCAIYETLEPTSAPVEVPAGETPVETLDDTPADSPVNIGDAVSDPAVDEPGESAAPCSGIDRIAIATAVASIFLWIV